MTENFNFKEEVLFKYDEEIYDRIMELFDCLAISALIEGKILAVHGGISPEI
jgi:serine/threonine-protein phosphatase 2B catalytic subunit